MCLLFHVEQCEMLTKMGCFTWNINEQRLFWAVSRETERCRLLDQLMFHVEHKLAPNTPT